MYVPWIILNLRGFFAQNHQLLYINLLNFIRTISGSSVPILAFSLGSIGSLIRYCGPETMGGFGDLNSKVQVEAIRSNRTVEEIGDEVFLSSLREN